MLAPIVFSYNPQFYKDDRYQIGRHLKHASELADESAVAKFPVIAPTLKKTPFEDLLLNKPNTKAKPIVNQELDFVPEPVYGFPGNKPKSLATTQKQKALAQANQSALHASVSN